MDRTVSIERTVPVAWQAAVAVLRDAPRRLLLDDEAAGTLDLHAPLAGFDVARTVTVTIADDLTEVDPHAVARGVAWEAVEHPGRFPRFVGQLELSSLSEHPAHVQVALLGAVAAPLGVLGQVGEAIGGSQVGDAVLEAVVDRVVQRLRALVAERQGAAAASTAEGHLSRPRYVPDA